MKRLLLLFGLIACWTTGMSQDTVSTSPPLVPNNGQAGITFEVEASQPVNIVGLLNIFSTATSANLWMRIGGVEHVPGSAPNISTANGWSQVITNAPVTGANSTALVPMDFQGSKISIPSNTRIGFFIEGQTRYQSGTASDPKNFTDGTLTVIVNDSASYGGAIPSPTFNPRRFLGSVVYELGVTGNCTPFTNFAIDSISGTSARVNWTPGTGNNSFYLEYGPAGFTPGSGTSVTGTYPGAQPPVILTGLSASTTYDVYVGELCNSGNDSVSFPTPQQFTTTKLCAPPTNLSVSNVLTTTVDLSWSYAGTAQSFDVIYGPVGFNPATGGSSVTVTGGSPYTLTGLSASTSYDVYLVAYCGPSDGYSDTIGPEFFFTNCAIATAPFTEKFDDPTWVASGGNANNQINPCWSSSPDVSQGSEPFKWIPRSTGPTSGNGPLNDFTGDNFMYCEASGSASGDIAYLTSPLIDVSSLTTPALYFMQHRFSGATIADMDVEVSNDGGTNWNNVYSVTGDIQTSSGDPWELEFVNLGAYTGDTIQVRFVQLGNGCCGDAAIDSVVVGEAPACPWPGNLNLAGITDSSATFAWTDPTGSSWDFEWGPVGYQQGTGTFVTTSNNPFTAQNLAPNTCYDIYIRTNCVSGGNGTSIWIGPFTFCTQCVGFTAPYTQNFDGTTAPELDNCWTPVIASGSGPEVQTDNFRFYSGPNSLEIHNSGVTSGFVGAVSPKFDDFDNTKRIKFWTYDEDGSIDGSDLIIGTMSDPLDTSTFTPYDTITEAEMDDDAWEFFIVEFDNYTGTDKYIAFSHGFNSTFDNIHIDDFVYEDIPACNPPLITTLAVNGINFNSANISWGSGSGGDETHIEWGSPGFMPGTGSALGSDSVAGTVDTFNITGLNPQTDYCYYIRDSCAATGFSPWVGPICFSTPCLPFSMPFYESLDNWTIACWDSTRGNADWVKYTGTGGDNYAQADFWTNSTGIYHLTSPLITISQDAQLRFFWSRLGSTFYDDKLHVRVQVAGTATWDTILTLQGADFDDPTAGNTNPGSFVEEDILLDPAKYTGNDITIEFIGVSDFGPNCYLNDIYVENAPSCPDPASLSASNITATNATLNWVGGSGATNHQVWYGPQGFYQGTQATGGTQVFTGSGNTSYSLSGLTSNTCYEYLVRIVCAPGDTSAWVGPFSFCTPCQAFTAPYLEDFENSTVGHWDGEDNCWDFVSNNASTSSSGGYSWEVRNTPQTTSGTTTGPDRDNTLFPAQGGVFITADVSGSSTAGPDSTLLISPLVDISGLSTPELEYHVHRHGTGMADLFVDIYDGSQWDRGVHSYTNQAGIQTAQADPWTDTIIDLTPYAGTTNLQVRFRSVTNGCCSGDNAIDDVRISDPATCPAPTNLDASNIGATSADLTWDNAASTPGTDFQISYGVNLNDPAMGTTMLVTGDSVNLTGLSSSSGYCYYVREICAPGDTSFWVGPYCFNTLCTAVQAPYTQDFESHVVGHYDGTDLCWDFMSNNPGTTSSGGYSWEVRNTSQTTSGTSTGPDRDNTLFPSMGGHFITADVSGSGSLDSTMLVSPVIDISNLSLPEMEYHIHRYGGTMADLHVDVFDGTQWIRGVHSYVNQTGAQTAQSDPWTDTIIDLSPYSGATNLQVRFRSVSNGCCDGDNAIDDVSIYEANASFCPEPDNIAVNVISCDSIELSWNNAVDTALVSYVDVSGGQPTTMNVYNDSTLLITGTSASTNYLFGVANICGADTSLPDTMTVNTGNAGAPVASFTFNVFEFEVSVDASASTGFGNSYSWDFGDTTTGSGMLDTNIYANGGSYQITLTVTNNCGTDDTTITVNEVSLEETALARSLELYPNPATDKINLGFSWDNSSKATIRLLDLSGKEVQRYEVDRSAGQVRYERVLNVSSLAEGVYLIEVETGELKAHRRVILR